jgi:uncharacterized protein (DUF1015 family)
LADTRPFRGLRYRQDLIRDIAAVFAPPYDVIGEAERRALLARSPYNVVRLDLGDQPVDTPADQRDYRFSAALLAQWREAGILAYDSRPAIYVYEQTYQAPPPRNDFVRRRGIIMAVKLETLGEGSILPHEGTLREPKVDRLRLLSQTQCAFSQVFAIYEDAEKTIEEQVRPAMKQPVWAFTDEHGIGHRFWIVDDPVAIEAARIALRDRAIIIADGHHRYETALAYREQMHARYPNLNPAPWDYITMYLCNTVHRSLTILPAHRLIRQVPHKVLDDFERKAADIFDLHCVSIRQTPEGRERAVNQLLELMARKPDETVFGAYWGRSYALAMRLRDKPKALALYGAHLSPVQQDLGVALLHCVVIRGLLAENQDLAAASGRGNVYFQRDPVQCFAEVDEGQAAIALLCNPTRVEDVMRVAAAGERMPQKGTYFWPKPLAGIVFHDLRPEAPTFQ